VVVGYHAFDKSLQRDDWRSAASELGPAGTAVVVSPSYDTMPLSIYDPDLRPAPPASFVREADVLGEGRPPAFGPAKALSGFAVQQIIRTPSYELVRYRSVRPQRLTPAQLQAVALEAEGAAVIKQR